MTTEQAIIQLSRRAEYAQQQADTPTAKRKAKDYVDITNTIIDYYNRTETLLTTLRHTQDLVQVLCEYIGIRQENIDELAHIPISFIRTRLAYRIPENATPHWLFHKICNDYSLLQSNTQMLQSIIQLMFPIAQTHPDVLPMVQKMERDTRDTINMLLQPKN